MQNKSWLWACQVTLLAGPTSLHAILHINTLARPAVSTLSGTDNLSMYMYTCCVRQPEHV